jgi:hypothetical protein
MEDDNIVPFPGFWNPQEYDGYTKLPHEFIGLLPKMSETELKITLYIMRHTWGFQEFDKPKKITVDEFRFGRKRSDGTRMDEGTGLSNWGVQDGLAKALTHGYIICKEDRRDKGRIKKYYAIKIYCED